jgi:hypothetical protein
MEKKIKINRDGSISITYGSIEKAGRCIHNPADFCGIWCPLFPELQSYMTDKVRYILKFICHGGEPYEIRAEIDEDLDT